MPRGRIMETPLRLPGVPHLDHQRTLLESAGWSTSEYIRCNSTCSGCRAENGFLGCAATPKIIAQLESLQPEKPPRASERDVKLVEKAGRIGWNEVVGKAVKKLGRKAETADVYREVSRLKPEVTLLLFWKTSVRQVLSRVRGPKRVRP